MVTKLLSHIRQFVRVRQALVRAEARHTTVTALLDNPRVGVLHLDRRGRVLAANDRARRILRNGDGLTDRGGMLGARAPADQVRLERLVGDALPGSGQAAVSGSMRLRRSPVLPPFAGGSSPFRRPRPAICSTSMRAPWLQHSSPRASRLERSAGWVPTRSVTGRRCRVEAKARFSYLGDAPDAAHPAGGSVRGVRECHRTGRGRVCAVEVSRACAGWRWRRR